jgi:three-Cys-motif partner protein
VADPYEDREQTKAKHFLLRSYLQALAFKILRFSDLTYVDGFSGPWNAKTQDLTDTSPIIAINALKDAQEKIFSDTGTRRRIRCYFAESNKTAYAKLEAVVAPHHKPHSAFEIKTYCGKFEDAVPDIQGFVDKSFALIFIDPTGWAGYPFDKIKSLFAPRLCEVIINFMYSFVSRFVDAKDENIVETLNPILGGPGWKSRLDPTLPRGEALLQLFRETLKASGNFEFVVATKIDKATEDRPHFFMAYATKVYAGLKTFRDIEYKALRVHAVSRTDAKGRKKEAKTGSKDLFIDHEAEIQEASIDCDVKGEMQQAIPIALNALRHRGPLKFSEIAGMLMEKHMLREPNIKNMIVQLERDGKLENTWGSGNRKPQESTVIRLAK